MTKTIKTLLLITLLLAALLQSVSSSKLRSLQEDSFDLEDNPTDTSDGFELGEGDSSESPPADNAANYDLGDADATSAPVPNSGTTGETTVGSGNADDITSFVLGDDDETPTVPNTQDNLGTTNTESSEFNLGDEDDTPTAPNTQDNLGTTNTESSEFNLGDDNDNAPVGAGTSTSGEEQSFDLNEDDNSDSFELTDTNDVVGSGLGAGSDDITSFDLVDHDDDNSVDLTDPAEKSSSTDKSSSGANGNGRALSDKADVSVTTIASALSGVSLQTGLVLSLVAVVSALML